MSHKIDTATKASAAKSPKCPLQNSVKFNLWHALALCLDRSNSHIPYGATAVAASVAATAFSNSNVDVIRSKNLIYQQICKIYGSRIKMHLLNHPNSAPSSALPLVSKHKTKNFVILLLTPTRIIDCNANHGKILIKTLICSICSFDHQPNTDKSKTKAPNWNRKQQK